MQQKSQKILLALCAVIASVILLIPLRQGQGAMSNKSLLYAMEVRESSSKPSLPPTPAPKCARKPLEASSKSFYPNWKSLTYQALDHHHSSPTSGNKSCKKTCKCLQNCVPCFCEGRCCSEVLSRRPYIPSRVDHKRIVVTSMDTNNYYYSWYAPITTLIWQNAMHWKLVLLVVYKHDEELTPVLRSILQFTEAAGAEIIYLKNPLKEPQYLTEMVVMQTRYLCGTFDWPEDTYVMITDLDMWPLNRSFFDSSVSVNKDVHVLYANYFPDPLTARFYPSCSIGMKISTWREIMDISNQDDIFHDVTRAKNATWGLHAGKSKQFQTDQLYFKRKITKWKGFPDRVHFVMRAGPQRLGRRSHAKCFYLEAAPNAVESHVLRPGFVQNNWPRLRTLLAHILTEEDLLWVDTYASHFCEIMSCTNTYTEVSSRPHCHPHP